MGKFNVNTASLRMRLLLAAAAMVLIGFGWITVRWQLGNMLAVLTQESDPNLAEIADLAIRWAPSDPAARVLKGTASGTQEAVQHFRDAVRLAPKDYRWRIELARALEQNDELSSAEEEFRIAAELAPSFSATFWHLGNFYLRRDRQTEALTALKTAAENNSVYRDQVFSLVWDFMGKDAEQLEQLAGNRQDLLARLSYFFAARGAAADALRTWNRLGQEDKDKQNKVGRAIALGLFDQKHFAEALEFSKQMGTEPDAQAESVTNASFERVLADQSESRFGWRIERSDPKFEATVDSRVRREGERSIRITFKGYSKAGLSNVLQTVVVRPGGRYVLSFWARSENLRSAGLPFVEVLNARDDSSLGRSTDFPAGTNDWQQYSVEFRVPEDTTAITIRTSRSFCGEDCPVTGILWYDAFELVRR